MEMKNKCPNCGKAIDIDQVVFRNCYAYHGINIGASKCCGIGFLVKAVESYSITPYTGEEKEDSWGNPIKKFKYKET